MVTTAYSGARTGQMGRPLFLLLVCASVLYATPVARFPCPPWCCVFLVHGFIISYGGHVCRRMDDVVLSLVHVVFCLSSSMAIPFAYARHVSQQTANDEDVFLLLVRTSSVGQHVFHAPYATNWLFHALRDAPNASAPLRSPRRPPTSFSPLFG